MTSEVQRLQRSDIRGKGQTSGGQRGLTSGGHLSPTLDGKNRTLTSQGKTLGGRLFGKRSSCQGQEVRVMTSKRLEVRLDDLGADLLLTSQG